MNGNELQALVGRRVRVRTDSMDTGWIQLACVEQRGENFWLDTDDGQAFLLPEEFSVEAEEVVGSHDFLHTPEERFAHIYQAYDHYGDAPSRVRRRCNCLACLRVVTAPSGRLADDTIIDDAPGQKGGTVTDGF